MFDSDPMNFPVLHCVLELAQTHVHWDSDAIQLSHPIVLFSCPQSFPASGSFPMSWLFTSGGQSIRASASASVLPVNIQGWFPLGLMVWSPCCPRDSQEPSPAAQLESISSSVLGLLSGPALTCICDCWEHRSCDCMDLFQLKGISAF